MDLIKRLTYKSAVIIVICIYAIIIQSCSSTNPMDFDAFSPQQDVQLGQQVAQQIDSDPRQYPMLRNPSVTNYVQGVVNTILRSPDIKYKGTFPYQVSIINDDKTVNAFCTPGGFIYVYTGILKFVDNEATLAGVLAHEIGHAEMRHATKRITHAYGIELIASLLLGNNPSQLSQIAADIAANLALLKNSRDDESEADKMSFIYLRSTPYYPGAILDFFTKVMGNESSDIFTKLLSDHPLSKDRYNAVLKMVKDAGIPPPTEANLFTSKYMKFRNTLR